MNKYRNKKTFRILGNEKIKFDSLKEARRYDQLVLLLKAKKISDLVLQPKYELIPTIRWNGVTLRKVTYSADFRYVQNGKVIVEDIKGMRTDVYKIKMRMFIMQNPDVDFKEL